MLDVFYFSIAGKKPNQTIDELILQFLESEYIPNSEKKVLYHTQEVAKNGAYPDKEYYGLFHKTPEITYRSLAEIVTYCQKALDFYRQQHIQKSLIEAINDATSANDLIERIEDITQLKQEVVDDSFDEFVPFLYSDACKHNIVTGPVLGISEIDSLVGGFTPGTVVAICAFTGHGKSTCNMSMTFKNVMQGKKGCVMSIEMSPDILWLQMQARYLYEVKGLTISAEDLIKHKLTEEMQEKVALYDEDFKRDIASNLMILDESVLNKKELLNYKLLSKKLRAVEKKLGGLDFVSWDHVHQLELLYPDCGNKIIKQIQSVAKTYKNEKGENLVQVLLVQCNREGEKRARKRGGVYDLQAIGDLNEVERTASYIIFLYASDDMKVVQEIKVTLSKNRLGPVLTEPVTTTFNPQVCVVGSTIEKISMSDDDMSSLGDLDIDDFDGFGAF